MSIARRSIRTTAAAAGIAALGLGFAGPALAAPSLPALGTDVAPSTDTAVPGLDAFTSAADTAQTGMPALPDAFSFQAPAAHAAQVDPSYLSDFNPMANAGALDKLALPTEMNAASMPSAGALPSTDGLATLNGTFNGQSINNDAPAMPSLDMANAFTGLASQAGVPSI